MSNHQVTLFGSPAQVVAHKCELLGVRRHAYGAIHVADELSRWTSQSGHLIECAQVLLEPHSDVIDVVALLGKVHPNVDKVRWSRRNNLHVTGGDYLSKPETLLACFLDHVHHVPAIRRNGC